MSSLLEMHVCLDCGSTNTVSMQGYNIHIPEGEKMVLRHCRVYREETGYLRAYCEFYPDVIVGGRDLLDVLIRLKETLAFKLNKE